MHQQVVSYQIADSIDVRAFKTDFKAELCYSDASELFYKMDSGQYIYVFKYGVVSFLNYDPIRVTEFIRVVKPFTKNPFTEPLSEVYEIETDAKETKIGFNEMTVMKADEVLFRLIMLNVAQSVALDYYEGQVEKLLEETNYHTLILEQKGSLDISGTNLKKYIGRTLLLKNRIAENLYIFDSPPEVWDNEDLTRIDLELKRTFDLQERTRNIHEGVAIIRDNLELFRALLQYRHSNILEWIVIILILVEVINLFVEKLGH